MASVYSSHSPQDGGGSMSTAKRIEQALMGMWHMMTESRGGTHSISKTVFTVFLLVFDFIMTAALVVHPNSYLGNVLSITIHDLLPQGDRTVFLATYISVLAVVWVALLDGAYVAWSFHIGHFRSLWPAQFLRAFIGIIGTALYNPFLEVLIIPLRCSKLAYLYYNKNDLLGVGAVTSGMAPWVAHDASGLTCPSLAAGSQVHLMQAAAAAVSVLALVLFVPFALSTQLVYIDSDPSSEVWEALSNGREVVVDSIMRTLLVGFAFFVKDMDIVAHGALSVAMVSIVHYRLVKGLPYFRTSANMARSALYGVLNWLAIECLTLGCLARYGASSETIKSTSLGMVATLPFIFLLSGLMPLPQYTFLTRHLRAVILAVDHANAEKELAQAAEAAAAGAATTTLAESRTSSAFSPSSQRRGSISKEPRTIPAIGDGIILAFNRFVTACTKILPLPQALQVLDASSAPRGSMRNLNSPMAAAPLTDETMLVSVRKGRSKDAVEAAERFGGDAEHVENLALLALKTNWTPALVTPAQHSGNCAAGLFSKKAIAVAESVFEQGLLAFPSQPGVRVAYARFLASYSQDSIRAIAMLQTALRCNPRLEDRFALFSFGRSLDQQRQSSDLGEGQMDAVGVIAFRQTQSQALLHHHEAVKHIHELWTMIVAVQTGGSLADKGSDIVGGAGKPVATQSSATKLTEQIAKIVQARNLASADYEKLLVRYPNAALLLRSYQSFATDVLCDPGLARMLLNRIEALERPDKGGAAQDREFGEKSSFVGSVGTKKSGTSSSSSGGSRRARKHDNAGSLSVANMKFKMQLALLALLALASTIFTVAIVSLQDYGTLIDVIHRASTRRYDVVALAFHTRTLVLAAGVIVKSGFNPTVNCRLGELCTTSFDLARKLTIQYSTEMQKLNADLYDPNSDIVLPRDMKHIYDSPERYPAMQVLEGPPPLNTTIRTNLLSMLVKYSGNCLASAQMPLTRLAQHTYHYSLDPIVWRYVQDNWVTILEGANEISEKYVDLGFTKASNFAAVAFSLLGLVVAVLFISWSCIFWPAAMSVQRTNAGVTGISGAIPLEAVKALVKRYERLESHLAQLASHLGDENGDKEEGDGEDGFSDRGLDEDDEGPQVSLDGDDGKPFVYQPDDDENGARGSHDHLLGDDSEPKSPAPTTVKSGAMVAKLSLERQQSSPHKQLLSPAGMHSSPVREPPMTARGKNSATGRLSRFSSKQNVAGSNPALAEAEREKDQLERANNAAESVLDQIMHDNRAFKKDMVHMSSPRGKSTRKMLEISPHEGRSSEQTVSPRKAPTPKTATDDADAALFVSPSLPGAVESPAPGAFPAPSVSVVVPDDGESIVPAPSDLTRESSQTSHPRQGFAESLTQGEGQQESARLIPAGLSSLSPPGVDANANLSPVVEEQNDTIVVVHGGSAEKKQMPTAFVATARQDPLAVKDSTLAELHETGKKESSAKHGPSKNGPAAVTDHSKGESHSAVVHQGGKHSTDASKATPNDKLRSAVRRVSVIKQASEGGDHMDVAPVYKQPRGKARITVCGCKVTIPSQHKAVLDRTSAWLRDTGTSILLLMGGQKNLLSPLLRSLSMKVAAALLIVLALQSIGAGLSYQQILNGAYTASAINVAGFRRQLTITSTFHARELLIGPDIIGTYAFAVDVARAYADKLELYHMGLLKGDERLRLRPSLGTDPAQDSLIEDYDPQGLSDFEKQQRDSQLAMIQAGRGIGAANITEQDFLTAEVANMGLHYMVMRYIDATNSWLATYEPWLASDTPGNREIVRKRYGMDLTQSIAEGLAYLDPEDGVDYRKSVRHNMTLLYTFPKYRELEIMSFGLLDARLLRSLQLYMQQVTTSFRQSTLVQVVVIVLNFVIILFLQFGVFSRQFKKLAAEAERTEELIKLIPKPVLSSVPKLRALVVGSVGSAFLPTDSK